MAEQTAELITLRDYWTVVWRRRLLIGATFILVVLSTAIVTLTRTRLYRSTATLIVEPDTPALAPVTGASPTTLSRDFYETQYAIIRSNAVLTRLVERCEVAKDPVFAHSSDVVRALRPRISVDPIPGSRLVRVSVDHEKPDVAARLAQNLAQVYIDLSQEDRRNASRNAFEWLSSQIEKRTGEVERSERSLLEYRAKEDVVTLEKRQALLQEQLASLGAQQRELSDRSLELGVTLHELDRIRSEPDNIDLLPHSLETAEVGALKQQLAELSLELARVSQRYKPKHPEVQSLEAQIAEGRQRLARELEKIYGSMEVDQRITAAKLQAVEANLEQVKRESMQIAEQAIRYGVLEREAESNRQMFDVLLQRLREADVSGSLSGNNIRILDQAMVPDRPYKPRVALNLGLGLVVGLILSLAVGFVVEQVDNTIKVEEDVEQYLRRALVGVIPRHRGRLKRDEEVPQNLQRAYAVVKAQLQLYGREHVLRSLLVTSSVRDEGKSLTAATLATTFAGAGSKVLLVDTDLFRGSSGSFITHGTGNGAHQRGLSDYFLRGGTVSELIVPTGTPNLDLLPSGLIPRNPAEPLGSAEMRDLIQKLAAQYELVILDSPPLTSALEVSFLGAAADATLVVVRARSTPRNLVRKVLQQLDTAKSNVIGVLLTFAEQRGDSVGAYHYYYGERYGERKRAEEPTES